MTYYHQTVLIPKPKQRFDEDAWRRKPSRHGSGRRDNMNRDVNCILSFFD